MKTIFSILLLSIAVNAFGQNGSPEARKIMTRLPVITGCGRSSGAVYIIDGVQIRNMNVPPMQPLSIPGNYVLSREEIRRMPYTNVRDIASIFPGIYQQKRGSELNIYAARNDGNRYIVDGMWCY